MRREPEDVLRWTKENEMHPTQNINRDGPVSELREIY